MLTKIASGLVYFCFNFYLGMFRLSYKPRFVLGETFKRQTFTARILKVLKPLIIEVLWSLEIFGPDTPTGNEFGTERFPSTIRID